MLSELKPENSNKQKHLTPKTLTNVHNNYSELNKYSKYLYFMFILMWYFWQFLLFLTKSETNSNLK